MTPLSREPEIIVMANALRLAGDPVQSIIQFCHDKVGRWLKKHGPIRTIWDLERIVCHELNLVMHDIHSDADLGEVIKTYVEEGDYVFASLKDDLDDATFAVLIRRKGQPGSSEDSYAAIIDCRGDKAPRKFFSRWHEIAHLLTLYRQMELPFHRSTIERDPTEKLMDVIAGEVGFYGPLFQPVLEREIHKFGGRLTLEVAQEVRSQFCPEASFQATLNACAARCGHPVVAIEIGMGYKQAELRELNSWQMSLLPGTKPQPQLRVLISVPNTRARDISLHIPKNMRVPKNSPLYSYFHDPATTPPPLESVENLRKWTSSDGSSLHALVVKVEAIKTGNHVIAIVSPLSNHPR